LEEVRKYKNHSTKEKVSIIECFEYYEKYDMYPSFYCNRCRFNCPAYSMSKIINCPKTLIINLNRGRGIEFDVKVTFEEYMDLQKFILNPASPYYYELKGVISHFGSNDEGGHFIAFCKNSNNCKWYKFNDEIVEKCSFKDVLTKGMPYVLFYSHVNA
jgi:ubiquitin C-terminal hydrolase